MEKHSIHSIELSEFVAGPDGDMDSLDIDRIFGKELDRVLKEIVEDDPNALKISDDAVITPSQLCNGIRFVDVDAGLIAIDDEFKVVGGYLSCDLSVARDHQGKGLGKELVLELFLRTEEIPTWRLDVAAYTPKGLSAHEAAWRLAKRNPALLARKLDEIERAEQSAPTVPQKIRP